MRAILADVNVRGHMSALLTHLQGDRWRELWDSLNLSVETFAALGLALNASDRLLWHTCQEQEIVFVTGNRNHDGPESLEAAIRELNLPHSLPVFTLADTQRILSSGAYADRVAERLLEYLLDIDNYRGTGRLYLP